MNRGVACHRVMSISHAEFLRSLQPLGRNYPYCIAPTGREIRLRDGERLVEIRLGEESRRRLGALELPETRIDFLFHDFEPAAMERFFNRFDLCFRRGGG